MSDLKKKKEKGSLLKKHENLPVIVILLIFVVAIVLVQLIGSILGGNLRYPTFITPVNILNIFMQVAASGILALGMMMIITMGGIDLSVGMLASLVAIFVAMGVSNWGLGTVPSVILGILLAMLCEGIQGFIISRTGVEPFIISLGSMIAFQGIALLMSNSREVVLNGELDSLKFNLIEGAKDPVNGLNLSIPLYVVIFLLFVVAVWIMLTYSKFGRRVYAIGNNEEAAFLSGIDVKNMKLIVFIIHGFLVGVASVILLARVNVGIITLGQAREIDAIAMAVIGGTAMSGGKSNTWGTFLGIILLGSIGNAMNMLTLPSEWQFVAKGLIIISAVIAPNVSKKVRDVFEKKLSR